MFVGTYLVSVTSGKRTAIPSVFRQKLGSSIIIAKWYEDCLVLVGSNSWSALLERLTGGEKMIIRPVRDTEHFVFASAYEVEVDDQGRVVLPERLVSYAKLGEAVYFLGIGDRVEIWNKDTWEKKELVISTEAETYIEELSKKKTNG